MSIRRIRIPAFLAMTLCLSVAPMAQDIPRPEHPRPQMQRADWLNLNGAWEFAETNDAGDESFLTMERYPDTIVVPFCRESELSGLGRKGFVTNVWYRRNFEVPDQWRSNRVRLHVGACDWISRVWVNGRFIGRHEGGNSPFAFDITDALKAGGNTVIIHAFDDTRSGLQPLGKQSNREESYGIFYTRTTGIWQTVWLEAVGTTFIEDVEISTDPDNGRAILRVETNGGPASLTLRAEAFGADGEKAAEDESPADWRNARLVLELDEPRLWSVEDPHLYTLKLTLRDGDRFVDEVHSYFGVRKVSIRGGAILINGEPVFQRLVLDQGFYPDGIWTAPSDEALRRDIELSQSAGFNGARLHQKVFEPRFLYWADKLGYLVWGEYPSFGADYSNPAVNRPIIGEWAALVRRDRNHPSVIGWCPFNETPAEAVELQNTVVRMTRELDPSRPVLDTSGWTHGIPDPELLDAHDYNQDPESFRARWEDYFETPPLPQRYGAGEARGIPFFVSEFGGIGWFERADGVSWGYGNNPKTLPEFYERFAGLIDAQLDNRNLFGYCYTQLTDVEQEKNGVFEYDRSPKFDADKLRAIQTRAAAYETDPPIDAPAAPEDFRVLLGGAPDGMAQNTWKYTKEQPGPNWTEPGFDDTGWSEGPGGFGRKEGWEKLTGTPWDTDDIWLRREFNYDGAGFSNALLAIHYDNATEIFLNGEPLWQRDRWNDGYSSHGIAEPLRGLLREGANTIAVHCHQDGGGQFIDLAILLGGDN